MYVADTDVVIGMALCADGLVFCWMFLPMLYGVGFGDG